ncbi:MAG: DNA repair exonuclease [Gammaproteobacteria bacterium]|nr:DNA repair exonuclease [Gammaproteobacteria bacterium]
MFEFIHAADLHLDSPLHGLERYEGAPVEEIRRATRRAFDKLISLALEKRVALVLLSGDLYDGDWPDYNTGLYFVNRMNELRSAGIRVCIISGNHDAQSRLTRSLRLPDNVTLFDTAAAETVRFEDLGCAVHGQGFATSAVRDNLVRGYPDALPGFFNIGMLHTCLNGKPGHEPYAPCSVDDLKSRGYDYWALGHVHKRELISEDPWIVFPGNIQGRHIREEGPKGCTLVRVGDKHEVSLEAIHLDVLRWQRCETDISGCDSLDDVLDRFDTVLEQAVKNADGRSLALRWVLHGQSDLHRQLFRERRALETECRSRANAVGAPGVWLQKIEINTGPTPDAETLAVRDAAFSDLLAYINTLRSDDGAAALVQAEIDSLVKKLPHEALAGAAPDLDDPASLQVLFDEVENLLSGLLTESGADG